MRAGRSGRRRPETFLVFLRVLPLSESLNKNADDLRSSRLNLNPEILFRVYLLTLNPAAAAALRAARSARRMRYSKYAGVSLSSFSQTHNGPLWAALLKTTVRCDATPLLDPPVSILSRSCKLFSTQSIFMNGGRAQLQKAQSIRRFTTAGDISSASAKGIQFSFCR
jgi:hypothetical protein